MLATNYDAWMPIVFGVPLAFVGLGLISFIPANRGHSSAVGLAAVPVLVGSLLTWFVVSNPTPPILPFWIIFPAPLVMGIASIVLWAVRFRTRRPKPTPRGFEVIR